MAVSGARIIERRPDAAPRRVTILGSTGSVGCNTIDLIDRQPGAFQVEALTAYDNVELLAEQSRRLRPALAVVADPARYGALKEALAGSGVRVAAGPQAVLEAATLPAEWVMAAIVGAAGLAPTLEAVRRGAVVALANKECLVCAGSLMTAEIQRCGATLLPVDSEHSAIFQVFDFERLDGIERIILTASGGPFRRFSRDEMAQVTPAQAVKHPNWAMGAKISVDSATMMNKGLEIIEAHFLFGLPAEKIGVVLHPQSVIHSFVEFVDGSLMAQLAKNDMKFPIVYALTYPERMENRFGRLDLVQLKKLEFFELEPERYPAVELALDALRQGGGMPAVLNGANEVAVAAFLQGKISFPEIVSVVSETAAAAGSVPAPATLEEAEEIDGMARRRASEITHRLSRAAVAN
jgi:1-deoxy-D-xylulose-5-phosphate reductoisomerase